MTDKTETPCPDCGEPPERFHKPSCELRWRAMSACICPPTFCYGVPICRACMVLDPERDCLRESEADRVEGGVSSEAARMFLAPTIERIERRGALLTGTALKLSQQVEQAERRAEEAEFHVEQLRDARDSAERRIERACAVLDGWEHDGPDSYEFHLLIRRVREALDGDA